MTDVSVTVNTVRLLQEIAEDPKARPQDRISALKVLEDIRAQTNPRQPDPEVVDVPEGARVILRRPGKLDSDPIEAPDGLYVIYPEPEKEEDPPAEQQPALDLRPAQ